MGAMAIPMIWTAAAPSLYRVIFMGPLLLPGIVAGKRRGLANRVRALAAAVPVSAMICMGLPGQFPVRVAAAVGLKTTVIVQFWPEFSVAGQVLLWEKSPLVVMLLKVAE